MSRRMAALSIGLMLVATSLAGAQSPGGGGGGFAERRMQRLLRGVTLTVDQKTKVDSITTKYRAQMPPFTPGTRPDSATRARMRALFGNQDEEIRALLTPDQQKVWDQNVAEMRKRMQQRAPGNR
ncbi:MAG: hypothetical protein ACM3OA_07685 [Acidobacteriota bacterium]